MRATSRLIRGALGTTVLSLAVLLALMASRAEGPAPPHQLLVKRPVAPRPTYATRLAPRQVRVRLKLPLTSALLFNVNTGQVLWSRRPDDVLPIASLTKMMTALVAVAHTKPTATAYISARAVRFTGSGMGVLPVHKQVPVKTLLYGLLLPSGNDAAVALAQHVAGSVDGYIAMMNAHARAMGLTCTHFTTVSGVIDEGNYSCTHDLATLAHAVLKQPLLARIVATEYAIEPLPIKGGKAYLYNNNPLLIERYPGTDGVKTGFTTKAGPCLVATARRGKTWLGVVLLHSANIALQGVTVLNAGFAAAGR